MFLVVVTLLWWRARLGDNAEVASLLSWQVSVKDVILVLGCLKDSYTNESDESETVGAMTRGKKRK
jgi:hypothetical protein